MADKNRPKPLQIIQNPPSRPNSPEPSYFTLDHHHQGYTGHLRHSYSRSGDSEAIGTPLSLPPSPGPTTAWSKNWDPWRHGTRETEKKTFHAVATPLPPSPCATPRLYQRRRSMTPLSLGHTPPGFDFGDPRKSWQRPLTPCCSAAELRMPPSPHLQSQRSSLATPPPPLGHQRCRSVHPHYSHSSLVLDAVATSLPPSPGPSTPGDPQPRPQRPSLAPPLGTACRRHHSYQDTPYTCHTPMAFGPCASPLETPSSDDDDEWLAQRRFSAPPSSIDLRHLAEGHRPVPPRQYHESDPLDKNFNPGRRPSITGGMPPGKCCGLCNIGPAAAAANWTGAFLTYVVLLVVAGCGKTGCLCLSSA